MMILSMIKTVVVITFTYIVILAVGVVSWMSEHKCHHEQLPINYVERMEWLENRTKTHTQGKCPDCKLWVIWKKKANKEQIMSKHYEELTLHEALDAKIAGKELECRQPKMAWCKASKIMLDLTFEYRIAIEPFEPKKGETVLVPAHSFDGYKEAQFVCVDGDLFVCKYNSVYAPYTEVKPLPQKVAREGWVYGNNIIPSKGVGMQDYVYVREILKGEE